MSWLQEHARTTIHYDAARYDFRGWAAAAIGCEELGALHQRDGADLASKRRAALMRMTAEFEALRPLFRSFVLDAVGPGFGTVSTFQDPPIFRVHPHGFGTISPFHKDQDFSPTPGDPSLRRVRNVWIPLTRVWDSNSLWVETAEGSGRFEAVELDVGEALVFDATSLIHGSRPNRSGATRVSLEFRLLTPPMVPLDAWAGAYTRTGLRAGEGPWRRGPVLEVDASGGLLVDGAAPTEMVYCAAGSRLSFWDGAGRSAEVTFHRVARDGTTFANFTGTLRLTSGEALYFSGQTAAAAGSGHA